MPALFLCLFASQAAIMSLPLVIAEIAADLDVSTAAAGQVRTAVGLAAGLASVWLAARAVDDLRGLLRAGLLLLAAGTLAGMAAPSFATLAAAQLLSGAGVGVVVGAGGAAAVRWPDAERRAKVLSITLL